MNLSINNVINVSVSEPGVGIGRYNSSNLALFSQDEYNTGTFGSDGYKIYLDPIDVATDFGTTSITYKQALAVFSQQPNILLGGGYLVILPTTVETQLLSFSATPASGTFVLNYLGNPTTAINFDDTATEVQTALRLVAGLESVVVTGSITSGTGLTVKFYGREGDLSLLTVTSNTLNGGITVTPSQVTAGETLAAAITRTIGLVEYFGIIASSILVQANVLAAAAVVQALDKIEFISQRDSATIDPAGTLDLIRTGGFDQTRGLYYGSTTDVDALIEMASYAGRALSTDFTGSNTTQTMHLKDLTGVQPDTSLTQTLLNKALAAGADTYPSIQGVAKVFSSGTNDFFDNVYNLLAFVGDIKVSLFNVLAQTATKIPQTENGISTLKNACRSVCEQYITNQFLAPGEWTSPNTFGNQADFYANIRQRGYYIYSVPVALQAPSDREDRNAPLIQIAIKYAGAVHKASVIININK